MPGWRGINTITVELMGVDADYHRSVAAAGEIGRRIAEWMKAKGVLPSRTAISGHSLGAQIAAFVGNACARPELFDQPIAAILAADPAGPRFEGQPSEGRLSRDDAEQVIVVHATELLGDESRIGSLDVYVDWPDTDVSDYARQHNLARELVTESFLRPEMSHTDGTPFGANALGFDFGDDESRVYRPETESSVAPASAVARKRESAPSPDPRILAAHGGVH
jgi:acetyl esterase/lipase